MKKLLLSLLFALVALTGLHAQTIWDGTADTSWYNETSTEFEISTAEQLAGLAKLVNNGNNFSGKTIMLTADIVLNNTSDWENWENSAPNNTWTPIGNSSNKFSGTFDGQGHTVSGIYINSENDYQGLFGYNNGNIQNVGISKSYIKGYSYVGGVCGYNSYGKISDCYNSGTVSGNDRIGGVCGYNYGTGTISNCYNSGTINVTWEYSYAGGICGDNSNSSTISNCYYLEDSATGGINSSDKSGQAEAKTAEQFASGEVCWLLNGSSDANPTWFQTINTDKSPVLDNTHGTVYATGNCPNSATYDNVGPSHVGEHADNDHDFRCDYCGIVMLQEPELSEGVYQIGNLAELYWFAGLINGTLDGIKQNPAANAVLTADITINENVLDANGNLTENSENLLVWEAVGVVDFNYSFRGTFDGQGHTVSGIYINSENNYQGLFCYNDGTIKNVGVTKSYIMGGSGVGGVCGWNNGTISNCYNSGTVSGNSDVGGVCGYNSYDTISNCYNLGKVNSTSSSVGGVCGLNYGTISYCYYLENSASGGIHGNDESGKAEVKTAEQFASGEVCWLLNGSSDANPTWFQTINTDKSPVLDNTHGTVYATGNCPNSATYDNVGPSHVGEHADNDHDFRCDYCGTVMPQEPELSEGVYQISNLAELYWFAGLVNGSLDGIEQNTAANAVLTADITINENVLDTNGDLTENTENLLIWKAIGFNYSNSFYGTFDGQGHTVSGIYINSENNYQGLFGCNKGTIKNLGVTENYIKGDDYVGGVCGYNYGGTVSNCYNSGTVSGDWNVGGVCGNNYNSSGTISNCYNYGTVSGYWNVGGVCGYNSNSSTISNCYYLEDSATGGINSSDKSGQAEAKTAEQFASGEVCWLLNGSSDANPTWFQTINTDDSPVLDNTHGTVYAIGNCPGSIIYNNNSGPSHIGEHADNDHDFRCDYCGMVMLQEPELSEGVYQISNLAELYWFAGLVNGSLDGIEQNTAANAVLTADIIINENVLDSDGNLTTNIDGLLAWVPIGANWNIIFGGTFDGQGHTVSGIYINSENDYQGLFGYNEGTIKNIGVTESYIKGESSVGGVCGLNNTLRGTISNCYNTGTISGNEEVGGVCGGNYSGSTISNCYNSGPINGTGEYTIAGGVCGYNDGTISNSYNSGTVIGNRYVGGVCGSDSYGTISNCYNTGTISGNLEVGGVCGGNYSGSTISNCYYLEGTATGGINGNDVSGQAEVKSAEQLASGEVCWLLNEEQSEGAWGQKLGTDPCPVLGGPAVFKDGETYYNEEGSAIVETNSEQASFVIVSENLTINIYGIDGEATVYNLAGNIVYKGSERIIPVTTAGMYLVRIGNEVQKTIVR